MPAMPGPGDAPGAVGSRRPAPGWLPRPSPIEWLCLAAGLALTLHYAWLLDDAYVYFRYVDNLLFLDRGLVYNPGEYVEGYSSPLWLLLLAALRATELNFWILVRALGAVGFVAFWALLVRLNRSMSPGASPGWTPFAKRRARR